MISFPFFEDIENKEFLIVGGGHVATGKVNRLLLFTDHIIIDAKKTDIEGTKIPVSDTDRMRQQIQAAEGVCILNKSYESSDLDLADYVIAATEDEKINEKIAQDAVARHLPVNVVDNPSLCTFLFPSLIHRGNLTIGISTGGSSPAAAQYLRRQIEKILPDNIEGILDRMQAARRIVPQKIDSQSRRKGFYKKLLLRLIETENGLSEEEVNQMIEEYHGEENLQ